ncbi:isocitrate lyase/phosphoenolpyruvate mutase family protein [Aliikangiella sp. IMCC44359]|uniref:isocitrate lyase/phosphoenolpyruvate mutase family protein n=1 Tax=Aliikangiella sp. IMCC44359 TaxID=3459125 RepID=UPI00403ABB9D
MNFTALYYQGELLFICDVWDVADAKKTVEVGFKVIAISSVTIANSLDYHDVENISFRN